LAGGQKQYRSKTLVQWKYQFMKTSLNSLERAIKQHLKSCERARIDGSTVRRAAANKWRRKLEKSLTDLERRHRLNEAADKKRTGCEVKRRTTAVSRPVSSRITRCHETSDKAISMYRKWGWAKMSNYFQLERVAKEKTLSTSLKLTSVDVTTMRMMGAVRKFMVDQAFACANAEVGKKSCIMDAFGSTNITSDYDVSIMGEKAPEVKNQMFMNFLQKYKTSMPIAFDTNLYPDGIYIASKVRKNVGIKLVALTPMARLKDRKGNVTRMACMLPGAAGKVSAGYSLRNAILKLLMSGIDVPADLYPRLTSLLTKTEPVLRSLRHEENAEIAEVKRAAQAGKAHKSFSGRSKMHRDTRRLIARHHLNYHYSRQMHTMVYGVPGHTQAEPSKLRKCFDLVERFGRASYFAEEAYLSPSTVGVIVQLIQLNDPIVRAKLKPVDYLCSLIENLGDFSMHMAHGANDHKSQKEVKIQVLKFSKYVYRMLFSAQHAKSTHILANKDSVAKAKYVVDMRGGDLTGSGKVPNLKHVMFRGQTLLSYIRVVQSIVLDMIEDLLHPPYSFIFPKP